MYKLLDFLLPEQLVFARCAEASRVHAANRHTVGTETDDREVIGNTVLRIALCQPFPALVGVPGGDERIEPTVTARPVHHNAPVSFGVRGEHHSVARPRPGGYTGERIEYRQIHRLRTRHTLTPFKRGLKERMHIINNFI